MTNINTIHIQYNKALRYFLLTKYTQAATTCVKALSQLPIQSIEQPDDTLSTLRLQLWLLYLNIVSTTFTTSNTLTPRLIKQFGLPSTSSNSMEHFCLAIWNQLVKDAGQGIPGYCDSRLVCAYLIMTLKLSIPTVGRQAAEQWFATLSEQIADHLSNIQDQVDWEKDTIWTSYLELVDVYTTQILPRSDDLDSAQSFVEYNSFLTDEKKESLMNHIQSIKDLQQQQLEKKKQLEQQQKEAAAAAKQVALEKERQQQAERELQEKKKKEAAIAKQQQQRQQQLKQKKQGQQSQMNETSPSISSLHSPSPTSQMTKKQKSKTLSDQSLTLIKTWVQQMRATGSAASVALLVIFFAILGLLKGPRGQLTRALRTILTKLWQTAKMGTKVTYM
ncbi:uncharacterized protein BX664DRAFT_340888 [Halteromyces radiatus]|uniref:uncharacterized protein n=1 Tax=Halteromyces radiatus TaxID=101107 RepID=UPI00221F92DC|nr:uncharacterized protein BX664DRAFT_340888 [Halteromyces radiatus]KAI8081631.1 hypothetical protein BX664DRAFT_340888 [Halteromyces radiatus]